MAGYEGDGVLETGPVGDLGVYGELKIDMADKVIFVAAHEVSVYIHRAIAEGGEYPINRGARAGIFHTIFGKRLGGGTTSLPVASIKPHLPLFFTAARPW